MSFQSSILDIYNRYDFIPVKGRGVYLYDKNGKKVLDFLGGIAVNVLGYKSSIINRAIKRQMRRGFFSQSNYYYNNESEKLAKKLCKIAGFDGGKVFFSNSGAEANECAIKVARKVFNTKHNSSYNEIICMSNAFHGRTIATISAVRREKLTKTFEPLLEGFKIAEFNNIESVKSNISEKTAAIMIETIQGEGGIRACDKQFLVEVRKICDENDILLILDEVQCGNGRTGKFFAFQHYGIKPDIITTAKGLSGGLPIGVCIMKNNISSFMSKGSHGSTFGGNALCCCVGNAVVDKISSIFFLKHVVKNGIFFKKCIINLCEEFPNIFKSVNGIGLMIGVEVNEKIDIHYLASKLLENGLSCTTAGENQLRFLPPLIIKKKHIIDCIEIIKKTIIEYVNISNAN